MTTHPMAWPSHWGVGYVAWLHSILSPAILPRWLAPSRANVAVYMAHKLAAVVVLSSLIVGVWR